jgi:phage tail-like protein
MIPEELRTQIFKTAKQWDKGGLRYGLDPVEGGGISLSPAPTFVKWIMTEESILGNPVIDECGQIYFMKNGETPGTRNLYRYDPASQIMELLTVMNSDQSEKTVAILLDPLTLWILDRDSRKVLALSRDNFQIKCVIDDIIEPVDIASGTDGFFYILNKISNNNFHISKYDHTGSLIKTFGSDHLLNPTGMSTGNENSLYILDVGLNGFLRIIVQEDDEIYTKIGDFSGISAAFKPVALTSDSSGNIFLADTGTDHIYLFDPDGSFVGKISIPDFTGRIQGLALDSKGNLYAASTNGIAYFTPEELFTKEEGFYYTQTLDSGIEKCQWDRLSLAGQIPPKSLVKVFYSSSDDSNLKWKIDEKLSDPDISTQDKAGYIDGLLQWTDPQLLSDLNNQADENTDRIDMLHITSEKDKKAMLFMEQTGRYLWLKIGLSTFDERIRPFISQMKVLYPRISYLRYLPAIYQEDPVAKDFLERFLSIFQTVLSDLETDITRIFSYFDPDSVPEAFLTWLASWMNLALDEDWLEYKKRYFIKQAFELYKQKGTPAGIESLVQIYTGKKPIILEHSQIGTPMVLNGKVSFRLGIGSILLQTPVRGFRLGYDSILGRSALFDTGPVKGDPFLQLAHRFTVILDLSAEEFTQYEKGLKQILDDEKPAHTRYTIRTGLMAGMGSMKIPTQVTEYPPIKLGKSYTIGSGIIVRDGEPGSRIERSRLGNNVKLM